MSADLIWLSAVDLVAGYRAGQLSPVEVVEAVLTQLDRVNGRLNAVVTRADDTARAEARRWEAAYRRGEATGPLAGVPITVKDLHLTAGLRTTLGSALYADFIPAWDQPIVARLKAAGAIVLGKTNTSEFGILPLATNALFGPSVNPWHPDHNTGGSSGGAAAAVAAGIGPLATASDGGGSIRIPASFCGVFGLKPQMGRIAHLPYPRGWENLSHQGPLSRTVRDAARLLDVTAGPLEADRWSLPATTEQFEAACTGEARGLRMAWSPDLGGFPVEPEVSKICARAAKRLTELGCTVDEVTLACPDLARAQQVIVQAEAAAAFGPVRADWEQVMFRATRKMLPEADLLTPRDLLEAHWVRDEFARQIARLWDRYDLLVTPTAPITAPANGTLGPKEIAGIPIRSLAWLSLVVPWNMTGQPAASLPVGRTAAGLPVGLQIVGPRFAESAVLRLSSACESAWPWHVPRPPLAD